MYSAHNSDFSSQNREMKKSKLPLFFYSVAGKEKELQDVHSEFWEKSQNCKMLTVKCESCAF